MTSQQPQAEKTAPSQANHDLGTVQITNNILQENIASPIMPEGHQRARTLDEDTLPNTSALTRDELDAAIAQRKPVVYQDAKVHPTATVSEPTSGMAGLMTEQIKRAQLPVHGRPETFAGVAIE